MENTTIHKINNAEENLLREFSVPEPFTDHLIRYKDDGLKDMHDLNYFEFTPGLTQAEVDLARAYQLERGLNFFKLRGKNLLSEDLVNSEGLQLSTDLTMCLLKSHPNLWTRNTNVKIKSLHDEDIYDDLVQLELDNFGESYGMDFCFRKMKHWLDVAIKSENLNYYGAYIDGRICGSLYTYASEGCLGIDGLNVAPRYRKMYVATTLLAACIMKNDGLVYLHAEEEDTPKEIYKNLGFETVDKIYWYV